MTHKPYDAEEALVGDQRPPDPSEHNGMAYREPPAPASKLSRPMPAPKHNALEDARRG
jgi:hypothetical protein